MKNSKFTHLSDGALRILGSTIPLFVFVLSSFFMVNQSNAQPTCAMICHDIQISLDQNCSGEVQIAAVLDASQCTGGNFIVELEYADGTDVPTSPFVGRPELGTITARVIDTNSGNYCWSFVLVEDKIGPTIECDTAYLNCWELPTYPGPTVSDNCFAPHEITVTSLGDDIDTYNCNPLYLSKVVRTWQATDGSGRTATCDQVIFLKRIDTALIVFPAGRTVSGGNPLLCSDDNDLDNDGVIDPDIAGVPTLDGDDMYPWDNFVCNVNVTFSDLEFPVVNCRKKIMRTWTINEWYCGTEIELSGLQVIEIVDTTGPQIVCPNDFTLTTNASSCSANLYLPPASASDDCSAITRYDVHYPGGSLTNQNGGNVTLPVGTHTITYIAYDQCFNSAECTMQVTIKDDTPPIAICDLHTAVSLTNNGKARVPAYVFDDGSTDECQIDRFEVRRMTPACGYDDLFRDYVDFGCCDVGPDPIMVVFRVYDVSGNYNECMVEVQVQDKIAPGIVCPPNITVSCEFAYDMNNLEVFGSVVVLDSLTQINYPSTDPRDSIWVDDPTNPYYNGPRYIGLDGYAYGSCTVNVTSTATPYIDQCGEGFIARRFTATNASGQSIQCLQTVSFKDFTPFTEANIVWPSDKTIDGSCTTDTDPDITGRPTFFGDNCEMIAVSEPDDWAFNFNDPNNPACAKILREWKVLNWCTYDAQTGTGIWSHTQVIKVINTVGPEITGCDDVSICSFDADCLDTYIDLEIAATDDCTDAASLTYSYSIDLDNDAVFDATSAYNPYRATDNEVNEAHGTYPIGNHRIVWEVRDGCGNTSTCEFLFDIVNCKAPTAYCYNGLAAELMPVDLDNDGIFDWAMLELWASDFDAGSNHSCYDDVVISFSRDTSDKTRMFTCDSLGRRVVEIWATSPNGAQSRCLTYVDVQDNNMVCPPVTIPFDGTIAGLVQTENGTNIEETRMDLTNSGGLYEMTDNGGEYYFGNMPYGGSYGVNPDREHDHPLNGVTANDLSLIQRHVARIQTLNSPYKHIAADANNDQSIDLRDVLELRKLLLGVYDNLPNNDIWRFYDATCSFSGGDPLSQHCAEEIMIPHFLTDVMDVDFVGVKIGDVDGDVNVTSLVAAQDRSRQTIGMVTADIDLKAGTTYTVPVRFDQNAAINAWQYTIDFDQNALELTDITSTNELLANNTNYAARGLVGQVWYAAEVVDFSKDDVLYELEFTALVDGSLSEFLSIGSDVVANAAFGTDGESNVEMRFSDKVSTDQILAFELLQNKPNPFTGETSIEFVLPQAGNVNLLIADISGRVLYNTNQVFEKGHNQIVVRKSDINASGVLYYSVQTEENTATRKMVILD